MGFLLTPLSFETRMNENEPWRLQRFLWLWGCCFQLLDWLIVCKPQNFRRFGGYRRCAAFPYRPADQARFFLHNYPSVLPSLQVSKIGGGLFVDYSCGHFSRLPFF